MKSQDPRISLVLNVDEIPDAGKPVRGELGVDWLAESLLPPYKATGPLRVALDVRRMGDNLFVEGRLQVELSFACSRTLEPGTLSVDARVSELFQPAGRHAMNLGDGLDADAVEDEPYTFAGREIDLEPLIREEIVLAQDPYPVIGGRPEEGAEDEADEADAPVWTSTGEDADPRWSKLKDFKLN